MPKEPGLRNHIVPEDHRKVNLGDSTHEFNDLRAATATIATVTGNLTGNVTGNVTGTVTGSSNQLPGLGPTSGAVTAADSGKLCIGVVDAAFTLPLASVGAGVWFRFMTGVASAGTGLTITRAGSDTINAKTTSAGAVAITAATVLTNTGATDVVWDYMTLVSDGVATWYSIGQTGIWA